MRELHVPRLALGEDEAMVLVAWLVAPGDEFSEGQIIIEVETDKATMEVEAPFDGVLAKVLCDPGTTVEAGRLIAWVAEPGEEFDVDSLPDEPSEVAAAASGDPVSVGVPRAVEGPGIPRTEASAALVSHGELRGLPSSRSAPVTATDSMPALQLDPESAGRFEAVPMSRHRQAVARSTTASNAVPQFAVLRDIAGGPAMLALDELRREVEAATLSDVILLAVARALAAEPKLNGWCDGRSRFEFEHANIALAVDGPDGVIAPVVRAVDTLEPAEVVRERARLVAGARAGQLAGRDLLDATFTISNIGPLGAHAMWPLLTPPQVAVLAIGRGRGDDSSPTISMTVAGDHRVIDGADGARFLDALDRELQSSPVR